jgi:hypothetical protein
MGWSLEWAGLQRTEVSDGLTEARNASAISLAPLVPMPMREASMEAILLALLLQTPAKMAPQPSSPKLLSLRSIPPTPMCVMEAQTRSASAMAFGPSGVAMTLP